MTGEEPAIAWPSGHRRWVRWASRLQLASVGLILAIIFVEVWRVIEGGYPLALFGVAALAAGLAAVRRWPWAAVVLFAMAPPIAVLTGAEPIGAWNACVFAAFLLVARGRSALATSSILALASYGATVAVSGWDPIDAVPIIAALSVLCAGFAGGAMRGWMHYWRQVDERAQDALTARELEAERRIAEERLQIARDLHDALGHDMAVVSVNLSKVEVAVATSDDSVQTAVAAVRTGVQSVMHEMQQTLHVLRMSPEERGPIARIDAIPSLIDSFRSIGDTIDASVSLPDGPISPEASSAAYRVVQEGLTNAHRHGTGTVQVRISFSSTELRIGMSNPIDTKASLPVKTTGLGLIGMRERIEASGGTLDVGVAEDEFTVRVALNMMEN